MKDNRKKIAVLAALLSVCMMTAGCSSADSSADAVKADVTSSADSASADESTGNSSEAAQTETEKKVRESQAINIAPPEENADASADSGTDAKQNRTKGNFGGEMPWGGNNSSTIAPAPADGSVNTPLSTTGASKLDTTDLFSTRDQTQTADTTDAKTLTVSDGKTVEITEEGIYVIKGSAADCTVKVNASKDAKVQLVLDNVTIENSDFPAIYVVSADKCFVTTASGSSNSLSVTGTFKADGDTNTDAVIFSKDDLVLNGSGSLKITSANGNGISGKDDLKVTGGSYDITSAEDAIEANDSIRISGGSFRINSSKDGLHAENDDDSTSGWIYISDGSFDITSKSDGIQATTVLQIDDGRFSISSGEGLEATYIQINGGDITVKASDDGVNASKKSNFTTPCFEMTGGSLDITMNGSDVDAVDANGSISVSGGSVNITCPTQGMNESFDYDGTADFTGGTITVNGQQLDSIPSPKMAGGGRGGMGGMGGMEGQEGFGGRGDMGGMEGQEGFGGRGRMRDQ